MLWDGPFDPQVYLKVKLPFSKVRNFLKEQAAKENIKIVFAAFYIKLMAKAMIEQPLFKGTIFMGKVTV